MSDVLTFHLGLPIHNFCPDCCNAVMPNDRQELKRFEVEGQLVWGRLCGNCLKNYGLPVSTTMGHYDSVKHGEAK